MLGELRARGSRLVTVLVVVLLVVGSAARFRSAAHRPHEGRFFDERYTLANVESVLRAGGLRPANGFYLALSYLPQSALLAASEALHEATGSSAFAIWDRSGKEFSPTAYILCRSLNVLFATASLWLTFLIGRRLWSPSAGLLAAAALAVVPRHLRCSVEFKPDIAVVLFTLLAFWWALAAVERPARHRFLRAGFATGLAVSAKYTGIAAALPVAVAGLAQGGWRQARRWGWLVLAGCVALATFVILNPYLWIILPYVPLQHGRYLEQSRTQGLTHATVLLRAAEFLADNMGMLVAVLGLVGAALLLGHVWRHRRTPDPSTLAASMLLVQIGGYTLLYAMLTPLFRGQNYLSVVPFVCLLAAHAALAIAARVTGWVPRLERLGGVALVAVAGLSLAGQARAVYVETVPSTWTVAGRLVALEAAGPGARQILVERGSDRLWVEPRRRQPVVVLVESLAGAASVLADGSDAEVFPARRLAATGGEAYLRRLEATPVADRRQVASRLLLARGEALTVLLHPWREVDAATSWQPAVAGELNLPEPLDGELLSVAVRVPAAAAGARPPALRLDPGDHPLALYMVDERYGFVWMQTPRFAPARAGAIVRFQAVDRASPDCEWRSLRWRRDGAAEAP